jgi:uncharacterized protein DUF4394
MRSIRLRAFVSLLSALAISPAGRPVLADNNKRDPICELVFAINAQNELLILDVDLDKLRRASNDDDDSDGGKFKSVSVRSRQAIGLPSGDVLVGIDFRPAGRVVGVDLVNQLYGLATIGGGAGQAQLYTINTETAVATPVGPRAATLLGTSFGFDFNPAIDRIRVTSDTSQNLRLNPDNGLITIEGGLAYAAGDPNQGRAARVTGIAYTNPDNEPVPPASTTGNVTHTVLYDLDTARQGDTGNPGGDVLAIQVQVPPNGQLNTVGRLGLDTALIVGFDIGLRNEALAAVQFGTSSHLAAIDLLSGRARDIGRVRSRWGDELLTGLAIELGPQCEVDPDDDDD